MSTPQPSHRRATGHVKLVEGKRGRPVYYLKTRVPGRTPEQTTKRLGPAWKGPGRPPEGYYTLRMANDALRAYLVDADRGTVAGLNRTGATFKDAAAEYLRYVQDVRQRDATTVKGYRSVIDGYLLDEFGSLPLDDVTPDLIDAYKERLIEEGRLSGRTIVRHLTVLHSIFKRAQRAYGLKSNPAAANLVERPQVVYTGEFDTYDRDEIELLATHAENDQDAALYRTAAYSGLRQGELLALRWRDIDFVSGLLHVRRNYTDRTEKIPKGKRVRSVPMIPDVVDALAALKDREQFTDDDDLVFATEAGTFLDSWALRRRFYRAIKTAGLRRIRFHDLRHAFGSAAITRLDGYALQSYMGHQHYSTTARYLHHKPRAADAQALHEAFSGKAETLSPALSRNVQIEAPQGATEHAET